MAAAEVE